MARTEEQKAARRERRAAERKRREELILESEERIKEKQIAGPYDDVVYYRCQNKGHYASACGERDKGKKKEGKNLRFVIFCFKCRERGHFPSRCLKMRKKKLAISEKPDEPIICYHCKQVGHMARNCFERQQGRQAVLRPVRENTVKHVDADGSISYYCKICKEWGHVDEECTNSFMETPEK